MMTATTTNFCEIERGIINALLYFEIFSYPLNRKEIFQYANCPGIGAEQLQSKLLSLLAQGIVFKIENFYLLQQKPEWVTRRKECNQRASEHLPIAYKKAKWIGSFPFVCGVMVSGSLSKGCMQPDSDIDFFIITQPGRLWLTRLLLTFYKKIFLLNSHKHFCINYFVDTEHLEIEEKNLFTAMETVTLVPVFSAAWYQEFYKKNAHWVRDFYPNFPQRAVHDIPETNTGLLKKSLEWLLSGWLGQQADRLAMHITVGFWKRKFRHFDRETFEVALKSDRHVSKHHPQHFQQKVLRALEEKWQNFEQRIGRV